ncbi:hypothetical protein D3C72_2434100 [compost metagenome]
MKVISNSATNSGIIQGRIASAVRSTDILEIRDSTNSTIPTGGVSNPIIRFSVTIRPRCTGSMP